MKFVLLGHFGQAYIGRPDERAEKAYRQAEKMGIKVMQRFLTLGRYDYCTIIDAPSAAIASAFDHWYSREGLGDLELLLVHDDAATAEMTALMCSPRKE